jgi:hypothetical protein
MGDISMKTYWKKTGIGLMIGVAMLGMHPLLSGNQRGLVYAQTQWTMTSGEWQALAYEVAVTLDRIGIQMGVTPQVRASYVPVLTRKYLQVFQMGLQQGATKQQANMFASQYITDLIQQLMAGNNGGHGNGVMGPGYNDRGPFGDAMSDGKCAFINGIPAGDCN